MGKDLSRVLGFWAAVAIGIAAMVGAGIFVVSGIGTSIAGSAVIIAFVIAGVVALFNALSSAELAAAIPREGGTYEYARRLLSPKIGFMTGWLFISSKMLESATVALAFGSYASLFLQFDPRMFAIAAVIILTAINVAGIRSSTNASIIMAIIKVGVRLNHKWSYIGGFSFQRRFPKFTAPFNRIRTWLYSCYLLNFTADF